MFTRRNGENFRLKSIKTFASNEGLYFDQKRYRNVYDVQEARFIYCELAFHNILFDQLDWSCEVLFVCTNEGGNEICRIKKNINVPLDKDIIYVREGCWGIANTGGWDEDNYEWEVYINDVFLAHTYFHIVNHGLVTQDENPYFDIESIGLFESDKDGLLKEDRIYNNVFEVNKTRYINIELTFKNKLTHTNKIPLDFQFLYYNSRKELKGQIEYFYKYSMPNSDTFYLDTGYGSDETDYWYEGNYTIEVLFMGQLIATVPFEINKQSYFNEKWSKAIQIYQTGAKSIQHATARIEEKASFEQLMTKLSSFIGQEKAKEKIQHLSAYLKFIKIRAQKGILDQTPLQINAIFDGANGTYKPDFIKTLAEIYYALDLIRSPLIHDFDFLNYIQSTTDGSKEMLATLSNDEVGSCIVINLDGFRRDNSMSEDRVSYGLAYDLMDFITRNSEETAYFLIGLSEEIEQLKLAFPKLYACFHHKILFEDFSPKELGVLTKKIARAKNVILSDNAMDVLIKHLTSTYEREGKLLNNRFYIENIIQTAKMKLAYRLVNEGALNDFDKNTLSIIIENDMRSAFE